MRIEIAGVRLELTTAIREYVEGKIGSLDRYLKRFEINGEVTAFIEIARSTKHHRHGDVYYAEATIRLPGRTLRAERYDTDVRAAIDAVRETIKHDIVRYKGRVLSRDGHRPR